MIVANSTMQNLMMLKFVLYFSITGTVMLCNLISLIGWKMFWYLLDEAQDTVDGGLRM